MPRPHEKRPGQVIALLVLNGLSALASLGLYLFYQINHIVYASSTGLPYQHFPAYLTGLLVSGGLTLLLFLLVLFGAKAGFWLTAVGYGISLAFRVLTPNLAGAVVSGLCLWLVLCAPTRRYFRVGGAAAPTPVPNHRAGTDRDPWEDDDKL